MNYHNDSGYNYAKSGKDPFMSVDHEELLLDERQRVEWIHVARLFRFAG